VLIIGSGMWLQIKLYLMLKLLYEIPMKIRDMAEIVTESIAYQQ